MNREAVFEQLKIDEGVVYEIYKDHLGYETFGVGHLVLESDPEHGQPVGTPVSEDRVKECFELDLDLAPLALAHHPPCIARADLALMLADHAVDDLLTERSSRPYGDGASDDSRNLSAFARFLVFGGTCLAVNRVLSRRAHTTKPLSATATLPRGRGRASSIGPGGR